MLLVFVPCKIGVCSLSPKKMTFTCLLNENHYNRKELLHNTKM